MVGMIRVDRKFVGMIDVLKCLLFGEHVLIEMS
jgi:hypothetical protein